MSSIEVAPTTNETAFSSGARTFPPGLFAGFLVVSLALHRLMPFTVLPRGLSIAVGRALAVLGLALGATSIRTMRSAHQPVDPRHPTTQLVTNGPYRYSRNPIYVGMTLLYSGISIFAGAVWPLLMLPSVLYVLKKGMIEGEERYLEHRFGDSYMEYKARVRRWL